ncbi:histidine kinase [Dactylosporangium sp. NPDC000521]|uniref:ATP-binding protein n=1 Tax=Dactylosporangium sp. NPDC000521 TaxID=3363975 RepID=UPI0036C64519
MDDVWNGEHLRRVRTWLFDGGLAGSVLYVTVMERGLEPPVVAIGLVMAAAMLARRRFPLIVACLVYTAAPLHLMFDDAMRLYDMAVLMSMFAVVKYRPQLFWGILAGVGAGIGVVLGAAVEARRTDNFGTITWIIGTLTVAVWFSAYGVRTRLLYVASLEERAATLERERDHLARLAAADERAAIARELHDVVAHSLSVMIVQADGAGYTLDPSASRARHALDTIAATGRDALEDMRRVVSVLRGATPGAGEVSRRRVGLAELDRLVERAGLRVDLETVGTPVGLSVAEELTAYRIVQESLTNTLRHAGPDAKVTLRLEYAPDHIEIEATDDGGGRLPAVAKSSGGHGLIGMRERVALHGGTVSAGPRFDGGWTVTATIPRTLPPAVPPMPPVSAAEGDGAPAAGAPADAVRAEGIAVDAAHANGAGADVEREDGAGADAVRANEAGAVGRRADGAGADAVRAAGGGAGGERAGAAGADTVPTDGSGAGVERVGAAGADTVPTDGSGAGVERAGGAGADAVPTDGGGADGARAAGGGADVGWLDDRRLSADHVGDRGSHGTGRDVGQDGGRDADQRGRRDVGQGGGRDADQRGRRDADQRGRRDADQRGGRDVGRVSGRDIGHGGGRDVGQGGGQDVGQGGRRDVGQGVGQGGERGVGEGSGGNGEQGVDDVRRGGERGGHQGRGADLGVLSVGAAGRGVEVGMVAGGGWGR